MRDKGVRNGETGLSNQRIVLRSSWNAIAVLDITLTVIGVVVCRDRCRGMGRPWRARCVGSARDAGPVGLAVMVGRASDVGHVGVPAVTLAGLGGVVGAVGPAGCVRVVT